MKVHHDEGVATHIDALVRRDRMQAKLTAIKEELRRRMPSGMRWRCSRGHAPADP